MHLSEPNDTGYCRISTRPSKRSCSFVVPCEYVEVAILSSFIKRENIRCLLEDHQSVKVLVVIHVEMCPVSKTNQVLYHPRSSPFTAASRFPATLRSLLIFSDIPLLKSFTRVANCSQF
jgi:hypothetical protein